LQHSNIKSYHLRLHRGLPPNFVQTRDDAMKIKHNKQHNDSFWFSLTMLFIGSWCRTHTGITDTALVILAAPTERVMRSAASEEREIPSSTSRRC